MEKMLSFTRKYDEIIPEFREKINKAEHIEDIVNTFELSVVKLLENILEKELDIEEDDIIFNPENPPYYKISDRIISELNEKWTNSDLPHLLEKLAEQAYKKYKHLEKHPEKTEAKIRMPDGWTSSK